MDNSFLLDLLGNGKSLGWAEVFVSLFLSLIFGFMISQVYKITSKDNFYENDFGFTLIIITVIINSIMLTIGSSIALSLGLIGSLSIIRFRTAIKGPIDMSFLFWSIATGLAIGANQYTVAVACSIIVIIAVLLINKSRFFSPSKNEYIAIVNTVPDVDKNKINDVFSENELQQRLKSSFSDKEELEMTYSLQIKRGKDIDSITKEISAVKGVKNVSILSAESNLQI